MRDFPTEAYELRNEVKAGLIIHYLLLIIKTITGVRPF